MTTTRRPPTRRRTSGKAKSKKALKGRVSGLKKTIVVRKVSGGVERKRSAAKRITARRSTKSTSTGRFAASPPPLPPKPRPRTR